MIYLYLTIILLVVCFSGVLLFGAPYLPTLSRQKETALDMLELKKGQTLLELGSGDGRVLLAAAKRGVKGVGIELNPVMYLISLIVTYKYRKYIRIIWGNFWTKRWPEADGIFVFLIDKYMPKLDAKIKAEQRQPTKVASFAFKITDRRIVAEKDGVFLYSYD